MGAIDNAHRSLAEQRLDLVAADSIACSKNTDGCDGLLGRSCKCTEQRVERALHRIVVAPPPHM
jgi:hypothetical protein